METMTGKQRVSNVLNRKPVDQVPCFEHIWNETNAEWYEAGVLTEEIDFNKKLNLDLLMAWVINTVADLDFKPVVLDETDETILTLDGNGAKMRRHKKHSSTPEHVGFTVQEKEDWDKLIKPHVIGFDRRRINFEDYRKQKARAAKDNQFFCYAFAGPFELIHPVCGHEYMLMGMLEDPDWVYEMAMTFAEMLIRHIEVLFEEEGDPDGIWMYEDMGFKGKPFMSPEHYAKLIQPSHKMLFDWFHARGKKVIVHSCGFVEPLVPGMIEAGMDLLQAIEVKAGMDLPHLIDLFGDKIGFCGGYDVRELASNDIPRIDKELERTLGYALKTKTPYILHSDHSLPPGIKYESVKHFFDKGRQMSREVYCCCCGS